MGQLLPKTDKDFQALLNAKLSTQSNLNSKQAEAQTDAPKLPVLRGGIA